MKRWQTLFAVLVVCLLSLGSKGYLGIHHSEKAAYADGTFTPIDLGAHFKPVGISDNRVVAGTESTDSGVYPIMWQSGTVTHLCTLDNCQYSDVQIVNGVSPTGVIVGDSPASGMFPWHAVKWDNSTTPTDLGGPTASSSCYNDYSTTVAFAANDAGDIAGQCHDDSAHSGQFHTGYWPAGAPNSFTQLQDLNGSEYTEALGINHSRHIVGYTQVYDPTVSSGMADYATIWQNGVATSIRPSGSPYESVAYSINNSDLAAGVALYSQSASPYYSTHPYVWDLAHNQNYDLTSITGKQGSASAVNNSGAVVGYYIAGNDDHAFTWKIGDNSITDLNDLLSTNSGWDLQNAYGINSSGQIVGTGTLNGEPHGFLLNTSTTPSYRLSLAPASQTATIGGGQGLVKATLLDGATSAPASNVKLSFRVEAGSNAGMSGTCFPSSCTTDANGLVDWGYLGTAIGVDTVQVWMDTNGNGVPDAGEPQTTATVTWIQPSKPVSSSNWAGYALTNTPLKSVSASAVITVPSVPSSCATTSQSAFWVGFNNVFTDTNFLPQVGFAADCDAGNYSDPCTGTTTGSLYYMWYEINPHTGQVPICSLLFGPGDKVSLKVVPAASQVTMTAAVIGKGRPWSHTFKHPQAFYSTMECIAEDPGNGGSNLVPFVDFGSVEFDNCSAIVDYRAGSKLLKMNMYTMGTKRTLAARTGPITLNGPIESFTVTRVQS